MWKTVTRTDSKGYKTYRYTIVCDRCGKTLKEHGKVATWNTIFEDFNDDVVGGWHLFGSHALCRKCQNYINSDTFETDEPRLDIKSFLVWKRKNNARIIEVKHRYHTEYVWPTLKKHGFRKYNEDSDFLNMNDTPRNVAERAILRGGVPRGVRNIEDIEFVYFLNKEKHECENIDIFWRKK